MASLALVFDILAKDGASGPFKNVGNAAERAGQQTSKFGTAMSGALKLASGALLGAGLVEGFKALYNAADESRKVTARTENVIRTTGGAANVSAKAVGDLAGAIARKTGVDDEAIQSGQNLLLTFTNVRNEVGKGNNIFDRATQTITDMSVALGQDTSSSAIQLGKALNDPIKGVTALQRVGVSFTASQKEQIRTLVESGDVLGAQKIILNELGKEFGGAAEAAATPLGKLQQRVGDLAEKIGGYLLPLVDDAATFFSNKLLPALTDVGSIVGGVAVPAFQAIGTVISTVAGLFNALPGPLQSVVIALGAFALLRGPVSSALETIGLKALYMKDAIANASSGVGGFKGAMSTLTSAISPANLAIIGVTLALPLLIESFKSLSGVSDKAKAAQQSFTEALRATNGVIDESSRAGARKALIDADIIGTLHDAGVASKDAIDGLLGNAGAQDRVNHALNEYLLKNPGTAHNAEAEGIRQARNAYAELGLSLGLSKEEAEFFADSASGAASATADAAGATDELTTAAEENRTALSEAKKAIDDYKLSLDILTGNSVSMIQVESALQDAYAAGSDAIKDLGGEVLTASGSLNLQSENGRKAADVLLDVRNSGNDLIATLRQQGATTDVVAAKDAELRASFIKTANEMGITGQNAETLADQILGIPSERSTAITIQADAARVAIEGVKNLLGGLTDKTVRVTVLQIGQQIGSFLQGTFGGPRAAGGPVAAGTTYLVGERGRELFVPDQPGRIIPANQTEQLMSRTGGGGSSGGGSTPVLHIDRFEAGGQSPMEVAESLAWLARTRG